MSGMQVLESAAMRAVILERDEGTQGVTICIPCFNQTGFLRTALDSAVGQTVPALEVIVVDDGSTEDVASVVAEYPGVRYLRVANRGLPGARNTGLMNARGHAFLPLDADDWIDLTYLEKTLPLLADHDAVCTGLQEHGERRRGTYMPGQEFGIERLTLEEERRCNRLFYCSLFRTSLLKEVGGYNPQMRWGFEDWDLWVDLMQRGARIAAVREVLFHYSTRANSMLQTAEQHKDELLNEMARHHEYVR